jgi:hypothetical protein
MVSKLQTEMLEFALKGQNCPKFSAIEQYPSEGTIYGGRLQPHAAGTIRVTQMAYGARKAPRRRMGSPAWIRPDEGFSVRKCIISDISPTGVRLYVDSTHANIKHFRLLLSRDAAQGCPCRVKWRRGSVVGAEFLGR